MEKKTERKWKTLRTLAAQVAVPEEEVVSVSLPEPVSEEPTLETPSIEVPVEVPKLDTSRIRVSIVSKREVTEPVTTISEDRDWVAPMEDEAPAEELPTDDEPDDEVAVFEEIEKSDHFFATAISMGPDPILEPSDEVPDAGNRILVAHEVASTSRLIRETLENFTEAEVETTADPVRAFELALQKPYRRFFFAMQVGELSGAILYDLISKAYANGRASRTLAPGVVFIREKSDPQLSHELVRDARVKDTISKPIRIERLLKTVEDIFEVRDPTVK